MLSIVLSRMDYREYDQIISVYTKDFGKKVFLGRGLKKIISKNSAHIEPFSFVELLTVAGKEFGYITKVIPKQYFSNIRRDYKKSLIALFVVDIINRLVHENEPDEQIFYVLYTFLDQLEKSTKDNVFLLDTMMIQLFSILGFTPELDNCVFCEKEITDDTLGNKYVFSIASGGYVCPVCTKRNNDKKNKIFFVNKRVWELFKVVDSDKYTKEDLHIFHTIVYEYICYHSIVGIEDWGIII
jgi:DNA repair protein RecO (recombination protein O)